MTPPEALQRIEECHKNKAELLDLGNLDLTEIPSEISNFVWLESLYLSHNQIRKIEGLDNLVNLRYLYLSNNQISKIEGLDNLVNLTELLLDSNEIFKIEGLGNLTNISILHLSDNLIHKIESLNKLENISYLYLSRNQINKIEGLEKQRNLSELHINFNQISKIEGLENLVNISRLYMKYTQISKIDGLEKLVNLTFLELSFNKINKIEGLDNLINLTELALSGNQISQLSGLNKLVNLSVLFLDKNKITKIDGLGNLVNLERLFLSHNKISNIENLDELVNLTWLFLYCNEITKIQRLNRLINLTQLYLSNNNISKIEGLDRLANLTQLNLSNNNISKIEGLDRLTNLTYLYLRENQITKIEGLESCLANILILSLSSNQIENIFPLLEIIKKEMPVTIKDDFSDGINLFNNPLQTPDINIVKLGNDAIINYFKQLSEQKDLESLYEAKLIIVGEPGAGKTSLTEKLVDENHVVIPRDPKKESTLGINIKENWQFEDFVRDNNKFTAHIWDFGGQEIQYMTHQFFLTPESLYVLVADDRKQHTLFPYWFEIIHLLGKSETGSFSPIIVVLNEQNNKSISNFDLNEYRLKYPNTTINQFEVDLADTNLRRFHDIKAAIQENLCKLTHIGRPLPGKWPLIRKDIMCLNDHRNYITWSEFTTICKNHQVTDKEDQELISRYLHRLGIILHFQDEKNLKDFIIINPSWAMKAIYLILEDKTIEKNRGKFTEKDLDKLWVGLSVTEQASILNLMKKNNFEICYSVEPNLYIAPQLLPKIRPTFEWDKENSLKFQYFYRFMPKGIITRLIVRKHEYLSNYVWAKGAIFKRFDCDILVTEEETDKDGFIAIEIFGKPTNYIRSLNFIRDEIEDIHNKWFPSISYEEKVPCNCKDCKNSQKPTFFSWGKLVQRVEQNKSTIECDNIHIKDVKVITLLEGVYENDRIKDIYETRGNYYNAGSKLFLSQLYPMYPREVSINQPIQESEIKQHSRKMESQKQYPSWLLPVIVLFGLYMLFIKFAPSGSNFDILGIFKGEKGDLSTLENNSKQGIVTIIGKVKINGKNANSEDVKQVYIKEKTISPKVTLDNDIFRLRNIEIPKDKLITIAIDMKSNQTISQLFKLPEPDKDGVCDLGEVLLEQRSEFKNLKSRVVFIIKNQNIQNNNGDLKNTQ